MIKILLSEIAWRRDKRLKDILIEERQIEKVLFDTPNQAIRILETDKNIDLLLVAPEDIQTTKTDLLNYVKTSARFSWIPIILLGRAMDVDFVNYCLENGISDILSDPVNENVLLARINLAICNGRRRILIVDDDEVVLKILKLSLEMERFVIFAACNAEEASAIIENETIHGAIIDVVLNKANGLEILSKIKKLSPLLPVVVITGHSGICSQKEAFAAGADGYFAKPFNNMELIYTLRRIFGFKNYQLHGHSPATEGQELSYKL